jgi:methionyl aminopeptidase
MIQYKTQEEIELIRESSLLVGKTLAEVAKHIRPGITGLELDALAETFIRDHHAVPSFKNYHGYPYTLCVSVNSMVVHGFPSSVEYKEGDIISVDCGVFKNGYHGDSAYTFALGSIPEQTHKLLRVTKESLILAIEKALSGNRIGDVGNAVQHHAETNGFSVVRELVGHGIGKNLHESPEVPNYGKKGNGPTMKQGLVIAIEPMINQGKKEVKTLADGWTVATRDGLPSAHFEHTVAVTNEKADVLSSFAEIEKVIKENKNLTVS